MRTFDVVARVAAGTAVVLMVYAGALGAVKNPKAKIDWDWPFIAVYVLLFVCIAALLYLRGQTPFAVAMVACVMAAAVFDALENLDAYRHDHSILTSKWKWIGYFLCVALTAVLFASMKSPWGRATMIALVVTGLLGVIASFFIPDQRGVKPGPVIVAAALTSVAFLPAIVILWCSPRSLLP